MGIDPTGSRALQECLPPELSDVFIATCARTPQYFNVLTEKLGVTASTPLPAPPGRRRRHTRSAVRQQYLPHASVTDSGITAIATKTTLTPQTRALLPDHALRGISLIFGPRGMIDLIHVMQFPPAAADLPGGSDYINLSVWSVHDRFPANTALRDAALLCRDLTAAASGRKDLLHAIADYESQMILYGFRRSLNPSTIMGPALTTRSTGPSWAAWRCPRRGPTSGSPPGSLRCAGSSSPTCPPTGTTCHHCPSTSSDNTLRTQETRHTKEIQHMRKVTAGLFMSLDGVVEAPNEWQPGFDDEMGAVLNRMLEEQDAVLLGRVTFTEWAGYWPTSADEPFASWINSTQKYVASSTLDSVGQWPNSTLVKDPLADFIAELREQDGGTIGTAGSPSLVRSLIDDGLLDELTLMISPVVAGGGRKRLFADDAALTKFEMIEGQRSSSGALIATYRPIR
ncbi:MAG: dihydrofolate reductase family protein [Actinomycetota bacterium]